MAGLETAPPYPDIFDSAVSLDDEVKYNVLSKEWSSVHVNGTFVVSSMLHINIIIRIINLLIVTLCQITFQWGLPVASRVHGLNFVVCL
jgi:hypothetical protein